MTPYHPHGIAAEYFAMQPSDTETNFNIGYDNCSLQPFDDPATYGKSFKDKVLLIEGIDLLSNANGHDSAGTILTGSRIGSSASKPLNSSLDQFLAVERGLGASTPITSLALGVGNDGTQSGATLSFGKAGTNNHLLVAIAQAFGVDINTFGTQGDPGFTTGALPGLV